MDATTVFEILAREHTPMLLAYLRSCVSEASAVDDLYQETMMVAWRRLDDFQQDRSFAAWVRGIAQKLVWQHYRKSQRQGLSLDAASVEWLEHRFSDLDKAPGDTFEEKVQLLRECIQQLPDTYRESVQLRYQQEFTMEAIQEKLAVSLETLKKRLVRAKLRLSDCIQRRLDVVEGV